jgi:regulator of protease activity HflC (stomatin/prohibitin superfamily)
MLGFKIINQYEQGLVFRWGKALPGIRQPGLTWVNPFTDRLRKVNMQIVVATVPAQEAITRDNVTLRVDAVVYYRVVDPVKAIINVQNYPFAVSQVAQTSLRSVIGQSDMDQLLSERDKVNAHLKDVIDEPTERWSCCASLTAWPRSPARPGPQPPATWTQPPRCPCPSWSPSPCRQAPP